MICILMEYYLGHQMKNEIGGACSTHGRQERCDKGFGGETLGKENTWKA
jgi:hypothetical protein